MICNKLGTIFSICGPIAVSAAIVVGCAGKSSNSSNPVGTPGPNTMAVTVNGSLCGPINDQYPNEPCGSVTICEPGTSNCQTINNLLIDTGSSGLRIFSSLVTLSLTTVGSGSGKLAECVQFGDGSSMWGPVVTAAVQMGGEPSVTVPIQLVNSSFATATPPSPCDSNAETDPASAGFNGILGIGLFDLDCGPMCESNTSLGMYFSCSGSTCNGATTATQVRNPVAALPTDNNGVILRFPSVGSAGVDSLDGTVIFGIGTQANNVPQSVTVFPADPNYGTFSTVFPAYRSSALAFSFIDSGSSIFFIPSIGSLPDCSSAAGGSHGSAWAGLFCPSSARNFTATNEGVGSGTGSVSFTIDNAFNLINGGGAVFSNMGSDSGEGTGSNAFVDWGIPFFYGRTVFVGLENKSSSIGNGVYWAY